MKFIKFLIVGILFGIVMAKSQALSWYRIQEMFRFQSFHMYGIIGTAVVLGIIGTALIKKFKSKDYQGNEIHFVPKDKGFWRYIIGGTLFGIGWAMSGACPGPIFILLGAGFMSVGLILIGAIFGTFLYGVFKDKLPH